MRPGTPFNAWWCTEPAARHDQGAAFGSPFFVLVRSATMLRLGFRSAVIMNQRHEMALQLIAFAAFVAAAVLIVATSLTLISAQCTLGEPFLPAVFPCFPPR
jgi:hypothetical protein